MPPYRSKQLPLDSANEEEISEDEQIDIGLDRQEPIRGTFRSSSLPFVSSKSRWERFCDFLFSLLENCTNFCCWCFKPAERFRNCVKGVICIVFLLGFILGIMFLVENNPEKSSEVFYTFVKTPRSEYDNLQAAIASNGNVCDLPISPRFNANCETPTALYGRSGTQHIRKIIEEGTRVSSMERTCTESVIPIRGFQWGCFDDSWFSESSVAFYDYNVGWPQKERIFNTPRALFLIRDPFDSAIDLYYRRYTARHTIRTSNPFSDHDDFIDFTRQELKEWNLFFKKMLEYQSQHLQHMEIIWYDEIDSYQELKNSTAKIFEFLRDEFYYPTIPQSQKCLETAKFPAFELSLPEKNTLFSEKERKELCPLVIEYWDVERWGNFCNTTA